MSHALCCAHPLRLESPEPPPRPPITIDGLFAAAALPDNHPHAFKFPQKKVEFATGIMRSPNIASKLKSQLRRRSVKALKSDEAYDDDNRAITSTEVVNEVGALEGSAEDWLWSPNDSFLNEHRFGSTRTLQTPLGRRPLTDVRTSVAKSLEWLTPLLHQKSSDVPSSSPIEVTRVFTLTSDVDEGLEECANVAPAVQQSSSFPNLLTWPLQPETPLRRTKSFFDLGAHQVPKHRSRTDPADLEDEEPAATVIPPLTALTLPPPTDAHLEDVLATLDGAAEDITPKQHDNDVHLYTMDISQQLRSLSAMSEEPEDSDSQTRLSPAGMWTFHRRERSDFPSSSSRHTRKQSSLGIDGRLVGPVSRAKSRAAASSMYSRHSSLDHRDDIAVPPPYRISTDVATLGWPLQTRDPVPFLDGAADSACEGVPLHSSGQERSSSIHFDGNCLPSTPTPSNARETSSVSFDTSAINDSSCMTSSPEHRASLPAKNSSSTLTVSSKRSRLFDRLSPPKKSVRKRRSIFRFLRPGSRKQHQARSISSPILRVQPSLDGTINDPSLLTVQYELTENPMHGTRSASVGNFNPYASRQATAGDVRPACLEAGNDIGSSRRDTASNLTVPDVSQRRPSHAEYERSLSIMGDDRRRPSAINLNKLQEVQEDDHGSSHGLRRKLSRAKPIGDDRPAGVMAQALERHQQEKAMFRSASKQRESLGAGQTQPATIFRTDTLTATSSLAPPTDAHHADLLDPMDHPDAKPAGRSQSTSFLDSQAPSIQGSPKHASLEPSISTPSKRASSVALGPAQTSKIIGTSLASWAKFPSHSRSERCGSAGPADAVLARDFAVEQNDSPTENGEGTPKGKKPLKHVLNARRSTTFGGLVRYYSNIFSSSSTTQNRRSSVATGGWLQNPDLELIPPSASHEPNFAHHDSHFKQRLHQLEHDLEDAVREDVEFVEDEATKLEQAIERDVEIVEEEAEELMHKAVHHFGREHEEPESPFHEGSPFQSGLGQQHAERQNSFVDPLDESNEPPGAPRSSLSVTGPGGNTRERNIGFDGASDDPGRLHEHHQASSKAEAWSEVYKECLMPPPALKPVKPRSPEAPKKLDSKSSIRRFPSVTVVDDRKGHSRSVSLISVKMDKTGLLRSSTQDLLVSIEAREREEREKLLQG